MRVSPWFVRAVHIRSIEDPARRGAMASSTGVIHVRRTRRAQYDEAEGNIDEVAITANGMMCVVLIWFDLLCVLLIAIYRDENVLILCLGFHFLVFVSM